MHYSNNRKHAANDEKMHIFLVRHQNCILQVSSQIPKTKILQVAHE